MRVGQRVSYTGSDYRYIGHKGRILRLRPDAYTVQVEWDCGKVVDVAKRELAPHMPEDKCSHCTKPVKPEVPDHFIPVYDDVNSRRLLGYLTKRPVPKIESRYVAVVCAPPVRYAFDPCEDVRISTYRIEFKVSYEMASDGWTQRAVFHTDAPLKQLMFLDYFRLPGENEEQAQTRRLYA